MSFRSNPFSRKALHRSSATSVLDSAFKFIATTEIRPLEQIGRWLAAVIRITVASSAVIAITCSPSDHAWKAAEHNGDPVLGHEDTLYLVVQVD